MLYKVDKSANKWSVVIKEGIMFILYALLILLSVYLVKSKSVKDEVRVGCFVLVIVVAVLTLLFNIF